jgi:hypothetical protein
MAADWIKIEHGLHTKPEVLQLADLLETSENEVVGLLVRFWLWADANLSPECPTVVGTTSGLNRVVGRDGFAEAMVSTGWLIADNGSVSVPNYDHHLSQSAKQRALEAKRKRKQRAKMSRTCPGTSGTKGGTREEKRREEKKEPPKSPKGDQWFDAFWASVHLKVGKANAEKAFAKAVKRVAQERECLMHEAAEHIVERMKAFARTPQANPADHSPVHPATWLNGGRYDDDPAAWGRGDRQQSLPLDNTPHQPTRRYD